MGTLRGFNVEIPPLSHEELHGLDVAMGVDAKKVALAIGKIDYAIMQTVNVYANRKYLPTEREIADALVKIAETFEKIADEICGMGGEFTLGPANAMQEAYIRLKLADEGVALKGALVAVERLADSAQRIASPLSEAAGKTALREPYARQSLFLTIRHALAEIGVRTSLPTNAEAEKAPDYPFYQVAYLSLGMVRDRLNQVALTGQRVYQDEVHKLDEMAPLTIVKWLRKAK